MEKSSDLAKLIDQLQSDLRVSKQAAELAEKRIAQMDAALEKEMSRSRQLTAEMEGAGTRELESSRIAELLRKEIELLSTQLDRRTKEGEELAGMHANLLAQIKSKDRAAQTHLDEVAELQTKIRELEMEKSAVNSESEQLHRRLEVVEEELSTTRTGMHSLEPKMAQLEPEVLRLRRERDAWMDEKVQLMNELAQLRPVDRTLGELTSDLMKIKRGEPLSPRSLSQSSGGTSGGSGSTSGLDASGGSAFTGLRGVEMSLSKQHAAWIGLPSLRKLSPELYENIRLLAGDLSRKENELKETEMSVSVLKQDLEGQQRMHENTQIKYIQSSELADKVTAENKEKLMQAELELTRLRSCRTTLDQMRLVLLSFPGGLDSILHPVDVSAQSNPTGFASSMDSFGSGVSSQSPKRSEERKFSHEDELKHVRLLHIHYYSFIFYEFFIHFYFISYFEFIFLVVDS